MTINEVIVDQKYIKEWSQLKKWFSSKETRMSI